MHKLSGDGTTVETSHADPDYAPNVEVFDHLTYDEIYRGVMALDPEVLTAGRQTWQSSGSAMSDAVQQAHAEIRAAIADGWRGSAAQLAANAVRAFESLGQNLADVMSEVGQRLGQANDAAETLRSSVSHPVSVSTDLDAALLDPKHATVNAETQKMAENVRLDVVRVMNSVYVGAFIPTGNNVPGFPVGGMYPTQQQTTPQPGVTAPGTSVDTASPATSPAPSSKVTGTQSDPTIHQPFQPHAAALPGQGRTDAGAAVTPASATSTAPASVASTTPAAVQPASTATPANAVAPQADRVAPSVSAAAPAAVPAPAVAKRVTSAKPQNTSTKPQDTSTKPQSTDGDSKHKDGADGSGGNDGSGGGDVSSGMGAGIVGGLAGGAFAMGDTTRPGNTVPVPPRRSPDDEYEDDEDYYADFDDPTYLEPAEPETDLVGHLDPTTPPVVGEWLDDEE